MHFASPGICHIHAPSSAKASMSLLPWVLGKGNPRRILKRFKSESVSVLVTVFGWSQKVFQDTFQEM